MTNQTELHSPILRWGCIGLLFLVLAAPLAAQQWSDWEQDHAVAEHKDWLVIKEPGRSGCYLKQSYDDPHKMELSINEQGQPMLWGAFALEPVDLTVTCQVDTNPTRTITATNVTNGCILPQPLVEEMLRGFVLSVTVEPRNPDRSLQTVREQAFSLEGLMDASEALDSGMCGM